VYGSRPAQAIHANIFAFDIYRYALARAASCVMLLSLRHSDKIKMPSAMRNSSARKRRVAEAC
jgi:hypothetical protein